MAHLASANYLSTLLWSGPGLLLPLLVINMMGSAANAHFYIAWSVGGLLAMVPAAVSWSLFAHGAHDDRQLVRHTLEGARLALLLLVPAIVGVFLLGDKVLLLFGRSYSEEGIRLLWMLALSTLPMTVNFLFFSVRRVQQRMGTVLLPRMGLFGVGVSWFAAQASSAAVVLVSYVLSRK